MSPSSMQCLALRASFPSPICIAGTKTGRARKRDTKNRGMWTVHEHDRFLEALRKYPHGPWRAITAHIGTRSIRQVQTHAHKYQEQVSSRLQGAKEKILCLRRDFTIDRKALVSRPVICRPLSKLKTPSKSPEKMEICSPHSNEPMVKEQPSSPQTVDINIEATTSTATTTATTARELPSLEEALDFFIERFSM